MRVKEFGSWASRDNSKGGIHDYGDGFNRELKGQPYQRPKEYAESDLDEYHKYPAFEDLSFGARDQKKNGDQSEKSTSEKSARDKKLKNSKAQNSTSGAIRNAVTRFVAVTAGSVVLVNTNPVLAERFPFLQVSSIFQTEEKSEDLKEDWKWSEDLSRVTFGFFDQDGNSVKEIPATVAVSRIEPTCTKEGSVTYTAIAEDEDGNVYSDTKQETLAPTGHTFGEGKAVVLENGQSAIVFECTHCHEQQIISVSFAEE